ncbi:pseudouridine synthase [Alteraurantiacibacter aestuarii]|uniref:Pseudouridine synthase n=1 Tax=Alteraurantiacibacter aestuarii TaxID=650004 RepID=A0A844ZKX5_9SPHN|nr:pseudouridine synthase [Alteraurantiacibacter aestuarii]MXO87776.1 pseudouridine synthase [Alteraurantiacibacter aestuarii]
MTRLILLNKPFGVLSQFSGGKDDSPHPTLAQYVDLPGIYPAGRLDRDSEGLLLLTGNGALQARIAEPKHKMPKTYYAQVEGVPDAKALAHLRHGVRLKDGVTAPALVQAIDPPALWDRDPPIRFRKNVPDSWISLTITEGRNRQVRRMTAAVGYPTLRLVRWQVGDWSVEGLAPGEWREISV